MSNPWIVVKRYGWRGIFAKPAWILFRLGVPSRWLRWFAWIRPEVLGSAGIVDNLGLVIDWSRIEATEGIRGGGKV